MVPVISQTKWRAWCVTKEISLDSSIFALETCYFGFGFRSRPGSFTVTSEEILFWSYSPKVTMWAIFEQSIVTRIPISEVKEIVPYRLSRWQQSLHAYPNIAFQVFSHGGEVYNFMLQREGSKFAEAIRQLGIQNSLGYVRRPP